jgi:hypothetical protein
MTVKKQIIHRAKAMPNIQNIILIITAEKSGVKMVILKKIIYSEKLVKIK